VPSFVLDIHLVADPLGTIPLILFITEATFVWNVGVLPAVLELLAVRTILVDGTPVSSSTTIPGAATVPSAASATTA
jgi:hypothetical protein